MKGLYLIQEPACLNPYSGAYQHIQMGVKHLSKKFYIEIFLINRKIKLTEIKENKESSFQFSVKQNIKSWYYGTFKDLFILVSNLLKIPKIYKIIKEQNPDFIYERASYLDFSGLISAKIAKKKHFYEANSLQFKTREKYYFSILKSFNRFLEKQSYIESDFNFFIGTYGDYWGIRKGNWKNFENGIEKELVENVIFKENSEKLEVCFIGRPMKHHGISLLIDVFKDHRISSKVNLHLIGEGFKEIEKTLKNLNVSVVNHGFKSRHEILKLSTKIQIGIVFSTPEYASNMKIFDYAALNCAVLSKDSYNLKYWFKDEFIFHDGTQENLKERLFMLINDPSIINEKALLLREKVKSHHTWDKIFELKTRIITDYIL